MYPLRALGRTHSTVSYNVVHTGKMDHISELPLEAPIINIGYYFSIARPILHITVQ